MKRYEKMSKEEIIEFLVNGQCSKCKAHEYCVNKHEFCEAVMKNWLKEEVETKPRIALINTPKELDKAVYEKWECLPDEVERKTFVNWLKEEVECDR